MAPKDKQNMTSPFQHSMGRIPPNFDILVKEQWLHIRLLLLANYKYSKTRSKITFWIRSKSEQMLVDTLKNLQIFRQDITILSMLAFFNTQS